MAGDLRTRLRLHMDGDGPHMVVADQRDYAAAEQHFGVGTGDMERVLVSWTRFLGWSAARRVRVAGADRQSFAVWGEGCAEVEMVDSGDEEPDPWRAEGNG